MEVRTARMNDLNAIAALEVQCFPAAEAASRESFCARLSVFPGHFWLLWDGGELAACVNGMTTDLPDLTDEMFHDAGLHDPKGKWQMIFGVSTLPAYRRRGCAARLLERAIADTREQGRAGLVLTCKEALIPYYSKFGFRNEGPSASEHGGAAWYQMRLTF